MEPTLNRHVSQNTWETDPMNRTVALRAFFIFTLLTSFAAVTGFAAQVEIAEVLFLIGGSLSALMLFFVASASAPAPVPVRVRSRR
jgi:amino acid permease